MNLKPGDPVEWKHYLPDGQVSSRAGTVVDRAPTVTGTSMVWWVTPDKALEEDLYPVVPVGKANARTVAVHCQYLDSAGTQYAHRGELYSSGHNSSALGRMAVWASYARNLDRPSPPERLDSRFGW
ncbi:MAG TPA: hypothetical protein VFU47_01830 [Armatimonadota bacterium]|nr:hypothetical protein [Armatimonadota bacterium]